MASLFTPPYFDIGNGLTPSDGALLYFNVVGSETDKDTYTTAAATTAHANPVVADAKGVFPQIFLSGDYDWVLQNKNLVQQNTGSVSEFQTSSGIIDILDGSNVFVKKFTSLADAVADTGLVWDVATSKGDALNIAERTTGNGGGAMWDVVLSSTVTENALNIVQCIGVATLSLVQREFERPYGINTPTELITIDLVEGQVAQTKAYTDGWAATVQGSKGSATYDIVTKAEHDIVRNTGTVDEVGDFTMNNAYIALLRIKDNIDAAQYGVDSLIADNSAGLQAAFDASALAKIPVSIPNGKNDHNTTLTITTLGFSMLGDGSYTRQAGGAKYGSMLYKVGAGYSIDVDYSGESFFRAAGVSFSGDSSCTGGITLDHTAGTNISNISIKGCLFTYVEQTQVGVHTQDAVFVRIMENTFAGCFKGFQAEGLISNNFKFKFNNFIDNKEGISNGDGTTDSLGRQWGISGNNFEGNTFNDIVSFSGMSQINIYDNDFEQITVGADGARIRIAKDVTQANSNVNIWGNRFAKDLTTVGSSLVEIKNCTGVKVSGNTSAFQGEVDRFSVNLLSGCSNYTIEQFDINGGLAPYPISDINSQVYTVDITDKQLLMRTTSQPMNIIRSANGSWWEIDVDNSGVVSGTSYTP